MPQSQEHPPWRPPSTCPTLTGLAQCRPVSHTDSTPWSPSFSPNPVTQPRVPCTQGHCKKEFSGKLRQTVLIRHWHDRSDFRFLLAVVFLSCPTGEGVSFPMFLFTFWENIDQYGLQLENRSAKPSVLLTTNACSCPEGWDRDPSCERHLNTQTSACLRTRLIYEGAKGAVPMSEQTCFETRPREPLVSNTTTFSSVPNKAVHSLQHLW